MNDDHFFFWEIPTSIKTEHDLLVVVLVTTVKVVSTLDLSLGKQPVVV